MNQRSMVDANILIFAHRKIDNKTAEIARERRDASKDLLGRLEIVRVSVIAWMEFIRGLKPDERSLLDEIHNKIHIDAVDMRVVARAIELVSARKLREKACDVCRAFASDSCKTCKRTLCTRRNMNDAIVVASAELADDVDILYCYDDRIKHFLPYVDKARCKIEHPPHPVGPLFTTPRR